jgi:hypothetical protein
MVDRQRQGQEQQGVGLGEEQGAVTRGSSMEVERLCPNLESEGLQEVALYDAARVAQDAA